MRTTGLTSSGPGRRNSKIPSSKYLFLHDKFFICKVKRSTISLLVVDFVYYAYGAWMRNHIALIFIAFGIIQLLAGLPAAATIGTAYVHAPAVILQNNTGILTTISLTVSNGTGNTSVFGPAEVGNSTIESATTAAMYASKFLNKNYSNYNFTYRINGINANVSGPSAGMAMTLLGISAFTGISLPSDFTLTGTISPNGNIGEIGGVYDKMAAAKAAGMRFALVPMVSNASFENELYYIIEKTFNIPLIQVSNISQASDYALYGKSIAGEQTAFNPYVGYNVNRIPNATLNCSNSCNISRFAELSNFTYNLTRNAISKLSAEQGFYNVSSRFSAMLNQSSALSAKGYYYLSADLSFLDYLNTFTFLHHDTNKADGLNTLTNIGAYCSNLTAPQITNANYEYVLGGELRQSWANYTLNATIGTYNLTAIDTDGVLRDIYEGASASGWCSAASFMYGIASSANGTPVVFSQNIKDAAASGISNATKYPGLYLTTSLTAYRQGNYPLALLDSDYAIALGSIGRYYNLSTQSLTSNATRLASNSTYGIWATEFSNEALFYAHEAGINSGNATLAHSDALDAYQSAMLASMLGNSTRLLDSSMIANATAPSNAGIKGIMPILVAILALDIAIFAVAVAILAIALRIMSRTGKGTRGSIKTNSNRKR